MMPHGALTTLHGRTSVRLLLLMTHHAVGTQPDLRMTQGAAGRVLDAVPVAMQEKVPTQAGEAVRRMMPDEVVRDAVKVK